MLGFSSKKDCDKMNIYFKEFVSYMQVRQNQLTLAEPKGNSLLDNILKEWDTYAIQAQEILQEDTKVVGEIVLTLDKIEQGIFNYRVESTSRNPMIKTLGKTINKMIDSLNTEMDEIKNTLNSYTSGNYRYKINIPTNVKEGGAPPLS